MLQIKKYTAYQLEKGFDAKGKMTLKKGKKLRTVIITDEQATELNRQKHNTLIEYADPREIKDPNEKKNTVEDTGKEVK